MGGLAYYQHAASGARYHDVDYKPLHSKLDFHALSTVQPIGVQQLISASRGMTTRTLLPALSERPNSFSPETSATPYLPYILCVASPS